MTADGSDIMTVVAAIADNEGNIKRLNNYEIQFEIEGPGQLVANGETFTNPRPVQWGTAPVLVRASVQPGDIKIRASLVWQGKHTPVSAELVIPVRKPAHPFVADKNELKLTVEGNGHAGERRVIESSDSEKRLHELQQELNRLKLKEVEQQQSDFE